VAAIDSAPGEEVLVLPNNENVLLTAEQAASMASRPARVIPATTIRAARRDGRVRPRAVVDENAAEMEEIVRSVATGEVTVARATRI